MLYATIRNAKPESNCDAAATDTTTDTTTDTATDGDMRAKVLAFCKQPHSREEIMEACKFKNNNHFIKTYLKPLIDSGQLRMTLPDKPSSKKQKYVSVKTGEK